MGLLITFWGVSALLCATPGVDWAYTISAALKHRSPFPAIAGMLGGHLMCILVVAAGAGVVLMKVPGMLSIFTAVGCAYLIYLALAMLRKPAHIGTSNTVSEASVWKQIFKGFGISGLNPKVFLLILVILPQFTSPEMAVPVGMQMLGNGAVHLLNTAVIYIAVGISARALLRTRPGAARLVSYVSGVLMMVIAVGMLIGHFG